MNLKYILATLMSMMILTFVACGNKDEDTAVVEDTSVVDAGADSGDSEEESNDTGAGNDADAEDVANDDLDGGSNE